jgi:glucose-6-phosphate isomerase
MSATEHWKRYQRYHCRVGTVGLALDVSRMRFDDEFLDRMAPAIGRAYDAMEALEKGATANPDENRMVGHYWLRAPELAPTPELTREIRDTLQAVQRFAAGVHDGSIKPPSAPKFTRVLSIGIGGSALGPEFVADALGDPAADVMAVHFLDNTDPDGFAREFARLKGALAETLCVVISKSGGTPETRNGMLAAAAAYKAAGLDFAKHAVAVTGTGSALDKTAESEGWLARFPMWDWVGGRTSELSAVGLLPAALQGLDVDAMLAGAAACDVATRERDTLKNPAARISVYGNKGSTDQHAYVQQLRDGVNNFFVTFIRVLEDGGAALEVEPGVTPGDYLHGFLLGTREALYENDRESVTISVDRADARTVGALIALFERAVGFYATLVNINAYHQPGVEAGKKAAAAVLDLQRRAVAALSSSPQTAEQVAAAAGSPDAAEAVFQVLEHLAANGRARIVGRGRPGEVLFTAV